jgi:hypothetical protein
MAGEGAGSSESLDIAQMRLVKSKRIGFDDELFECAGWFIGIG